MIKQSLNIIQFKPLYKILLEIKEIFIFDIFYYESVVEYLSIKKKPSDESNNSLFLIDKINLKINLNKIINKNNILIIDKLPIRINQLNDKINSELIKIKYNSQASLTIKNYVLNLNSRTIIKDKKELKLTEKEINIILFLYNEKLAQPVNVLQNKVWGYSKNSETHTVETHVYRLRKKINEIFNDEKFIISSSNGYSI